MFSGIVDHCGTLISVESQENQAKFWIASQFVDFALGESIAVDGICLTVMDLRDNQFACVLSAETLSITRADQYQPGQILNLERAIRFSDRVSGHFVMGHVDETISVADIRQHNECREIVFSAISEQSCAYLVGKGSVAINGVSLTVNQVYHNSFNIMLVPHTLERTNLSDLKTDQSVNVEWDYMAKLVARQLKCMDSALNAE